MAEDRSDDGARRFAADGAGIPAEASPSVGGVAAEATPSAGGVAADTNYSAGGVATEATPSVGGVAAETVRWWQGLGDDGRAALEADTRALDDTWRYAAARGIPVDGDAAQRLAQRHVRWLAAAADGHEVTADYLRGLAEMYVDDERFWVTYGGRAGAEFVRGALRVYADRLVAG